MLLQNEGDLILVLGIATAVLLTIALAAGIIASLKTHQVKQFQDQLFKAERKIDQLERRMFNVLNAVPVALVETDITGKFTFANRAAHQLLGRKDSELINLRFHSATWGIAYPDGRQIPTDLMPISRALRGQTVKGFQHLMSRQDTKDRLLVSVTSMPIMNSAGEIIGSTSAIVELETQSGEGVGDLTGLWRGTWFTSALVPFFGLDSQGQIIDINAPACKALNLRREQGLGQDFAERFIEPDDLRRAKDYFKGILADNSDQAVEIPLRLKTLDGRASTYVVSAWAVKAAAEGETGLTLMALPAEGLLPGADEVITRLSLQDVNEDARQELEDLKQAEASRAALGIGIWQYDAESDSIIEDEGMRRLIGREYEGGPTLISEEDQSIADEAFMSLLSGHSDAINIDIRVVGKDLKERWITLKGQAERGAEGQPPSIYGVAFDCTQWKMNDRLLTLQSSAETAETAHQKALDELSLAQTKIEDLERLVAEAEAAAAVPVEQPNTEALTALENERDALRTQLSQTEADLEAERTRLQELSLEMAKAPAESPAAQGKTIRDIVPDISSLYRAFSRRDGQVSLIDLSTEWQVLSGLGAYEFLGDGWLDTIVEADQDRVLATIKNGFDEAKPFALQYQVKTTDGVRLMDEHLCPEYDEMGDVNALVAVGFARELPAPIVEAPLEPVAPPEPVIVTQDNPEHLAEIEALKADLVTKSAEIEAIKLQAEQDAALLAQSHDSVSRDLEAQKAALTEAEAVKAQLEAKAAEYEALKLQADQDAALLAQMRENLSRELSDHRTALLEAEAVRARLEAQIAELESRPEPEPLPAPEPIVLPDPAQDKKIAELSFELTKYQAAYQDAQARLEGFERELATLKNVPVVDTAPLEARVAALEGDLMSAQTRQAELQKVADQLSESLSQAQRFETVGRLTADVAQDFAQMLAVVNNALEVMSKSADNPEQVRKLSEAALNAGRRGERLTRQLQAFNQPDYW